MKIAIIGPWSFERLSATMEKLMTESQCYLFTVLCGGTELRAVNLSIGYQWGTTHGAPIEFLIENNVDKMIERLVNEIDFVVAFDDGNSITRRIIMKMNMAGKHGRVESWN